MSGCIRFGFLRVRFGNTIVSTLFTSLVASCIDLTIESMSF